MTEFKPWPKTPRLNRNITVTEKIDGTNAAVQIEDLGEIAPGDPVADDVVVEEGFAYRVTAQSRKRLIYPGDDNYGFAGWVRANAAALVEILGEGCHYGEWWGSGIQRGYGLTKGEKRFSLFNVHRYRDVGDRLPGLGVVPTIFEGDFSAEGIDGSLATLRQMGSVAAPGFDRPEGVIVYHSAARSVFKVLLEGDDHPKGNAA